ncbi:MAG: glycosyltransferase family 1 protein [Coleofasciculus sp. A1-SPW-01]|uniref:glycosyltransferase family 4 protein n=1 Tax=Coleofasciculus sp. A1-SPW-01 TaxID=3070819 RepID=UPI0032FA94B0
MENKIVILSMYYRNNSITATKKIFDEVWSRVYNKNLAKLLLIVPKGNRPDWIAKDSCIEVSYNNNSGFLGRLNVSKKLNHILWNLPRSIVINDFFPVPFTGLSKHIHVQFVPHIYTSRESWLRHIGFIQQISKMRNSGYVLTISETSKKEIVDFCNLNSKNIIVSYCGISNVILQSKVIDKSSYIKNYDVLYVATFIRRKNHMNLIKALPMIGTPIKLALLGKDLGYRTKVESLIGKLELQDRVDFLEPVSESELANLYSCSRIFVSPSLREGFGMPVVEALATGTPVVCSNLPVFREIAGSWASYFDPENPVSIARVLKSSLESSDLSVNQALAAREYVKQKFSWDTIVGKLLAQLNEL